MDLVLLLARLFLALIFGVAGIVKVADTAGFRRTLLGFGVPEKLASPLGLGLPFLEILIAVALLPLVSAWWGAVAALALLIIFAVGIGVNLSRGQAPECNCFGQLHSEPVSWSLFTRDLLMAAVAALVVVQGKVNPGLSAFAWMNNLKTVEIVNLLLGSVAVGLLVAAVAYLRRVLTNQATVLERIDAMKKVIDEDYAEPAPVEHAAAVAPVEGLPIGALAPSFSLNSVGGEQVSLDDLLAYGKPVLLLFVSPNCAPCKALLPVARAWERDHASRLTVALLSTGTSKEVHDRVAKHGVKNLLLQGDFAVSEHYRAKWTPAAVLIDSKGRVASSVTYGEDAIRALVDQGVSPGAKLAANNGSSRYLPDVTVGTSNLKFGDQAPSFSLVDLQGNVVETEALLGRDTLLMFWDPGCPYCRALSDDLKRWEEKPPKRAPRMVVVASGDPDAVRAQAKDFTSPVLLDPEFETAPLFGSNSTPSAILIDSEGRIASALAMGGPNVLVMAGHRKMELQVVSNFGGALEAQPSRIQ